MNTPTPIAISTLHETICLIDTPDRYIAHVEIDRQWKEFPRGQDRFWRYGIFQIGQKSLSVIRTDNPVVGSHWKQVAAPEDGMLHGIVLASPKKPRQFSAFRNDAVATRFFHERLSSFGMLEKLDVKKPITVAINKPRCKFTMPARFAFFSLKLNAGNCNALNLLMTGGIGAARSFGMGFVIPKGTRVYEILSDMVD